ncbi:MAG: mandelate racemase/muconate lactonizing enzyme family protein [Alphaproteobacteria bacterium]
MRIVDIVEKTVSLKSDIRNAYVDFSQMTCSVVAVVTDLLRDGRPVVGYGFNSNGRYGQGALMRERFIPRIQAADPAALLDTDGFVDPAKVNDVMRVNEKPGGHGDRSVAFGTIDMALWDALAKAHGVPLWRLLADRYNDGEADAAVFVYAAGGYYYPGKGLEALQDEMRGYLDLGYDIVKMKIGGEDIASDQARIEAALAVVGDGQRLAVDANGRFDLETAIAYADMMSPYNLFWYEEAGDPLDYQLQAVLGEVYPGAMATGENLFSLQDARNLIRHAGMRADRDWLQFDPPLSYGLVEYLDVLAMLRMSGWSPRRCIPHGGHQFALNIAAGLGLGGNESYPGVFQPFGGFADESRVENGRITLPDAPGVGFELKSKLWDTVLKDMAG